MTGLLTIKKGATLQLIFALTNDDNSPADLTGITVTSQVRDVSNVLIADLPLVATATVGQLSVTQATDNWPTGPLTMDLKLVTGGVVIKSDSQTILVEPAITA